MVRTITRSFLFLLISTLCFNISTAQTAQQRKAIAKKSNVEQLETMAASFEAKYKVNQQEAMEYARQHNIPLIKEKPNGGIAILQKILEDGTPLYYSTYNRGASITTQTDELYPGGDLNISVTGEGMIIGVWDGGKVETTHELIEERAVQIDGAIIPSDHATHVCGTLIGSPIPENGNARGMAYEATAWANSFNNDLSEMSAQAADGLLVSNHSYGYSAEDLPDYYFGYYDSKAAAVDDIAYNAPYYLMVVSAGNDRGEGYNAADEGYDLLTDQGLAKNNLTVAAVFEVNNYTGPASVEMSSFSSFGPPDDGRIKPDISGKGVNVFSSVATGVNAYSYYSGTSMATPNVAGSLILLQQLHYNLYGSFMRAATLKAIALHTALEAGDHPGPDYRFGWGLLNMEGAARLLLENNFRSVYEENKLLEGEVDTLEVVADGDESLIATLVWTDPAGNVDPANEIGANNLVNDLDIRIVDEEGNIFYPWKLNRFEFETAAFTGDNDVDNVEKVEIAAPSGTYDVIITHEGALQGGSQEYSLVISGVQEGDFTFTPESLETSVCDFEDVALVFNYFTDESNEEATSLSVSGLPEGATATFSSETITEEGTFVLDITGLDGTASGIYPITVTATNANFSQDVTIDLNVTNAAPLEDIEITYPSDGQENVGIYPTLTWSEVANADFYELEVSTEPDFSSAFFSGEPEVPSQGIPGLSPLTQYYWRVRPRNSCVEGNYASGSFTTEALNCQAIVVASDTPVAIPTTEASVSSTITVPASENMVISDVNVSVGIEHSYVGDFTIVLTGPSGTEAVLVSNVCGEGNDVEAVFDDTGSAFSCATIPPVIAGIYEPLTPLNVFIGEETQGQWTLTVIDQYDGDGGAITNFGLTFCVSGSVNVADNEIPELKLYPNPAQDYFNVSFPQAEETVVIDVYDLNGRNIISRNFDNSDSNFQEKIQTSTLSTGIYFVEVKNGNRTAIKKLIVE